MKHNLRDRNVFLGTLAQTQAVFEETLPVILSRPCTGTFRRPCCIYTWTLSTQKGRETTMSNASDTETCTEKKGLYCRKRKHIYTQH